MLTESLGETERPGSRRAHGRLTRAPGGHRPDGRRASGPGGALTGPSRGDTGRGRQRRPGLLLGPRRRAPTAGRRPARATYRVVAQRNRAARLDGGATDAFSERLRISWPRSTAWSAGWRRSAPRCRPTRPTWPTLAPGRGRRRLRPRNGLCIDDDGQVRPRTGPLAVEVALGRRAAMPLAQHQVDGAQGRGPGRGRPAPPAGRRPRCRDSASTPGAWSAWTP